MIITIFVIIIVVFCLIVIFFITIAITIVIAIAILILFLLIIIINNIIMRLRTTRLYSTHHHCHPPRCSPFQRAAQLSAHKEGEVKEQGEAPGPQSALLAVPLHRKSKLTADAQGTPNSPKTPASSHDPDTNTVATFEVPDKVNKQNVSIPSRLRFPVYFSDRRQRCSAKSDETLNSLNPRLPKP
jgi:hypothetical protein